MSLFGINFFKKKTVLSDNFHKQQGGDIPEMENTCSGILFQFISVYSGYSGIFFPDIPGLFDGKVYGPKDLNHKTGQSMGKKKA
jgi:hypothetical protein